MCSIIFGVSSNHMRNFIAREIVAVFSKLMVLDSYSISALEFHEVHVYIVIDYQLLVKEITLLIMKY